MSEVLPCPGLPMIACVCERRERGEKDDDDGDDDEIKRRRKETERGLRKQTPAAAAHGALLLMFKGSTRSSFSVICLFLCLSNRFRLR